MRDGGGGDDARGSPDVTNFTVPYGVAPFDAAEALDAAASDCVDIEPSAADLVCATDQDCAAGYGGNVCANECWSCENKDTAMSAAAAATYQSELEALPSMALCGPCALPLSVPVACVGGKCVGCLPGHDGGAACGDAG